MYLLIVIVYLLLFMLYYIFPAAFDVIRVRNIPVYNTSVIM
jgi:hypothetical protein